MPASLASLLAAVVGAGIGGSAVAYFLQQHFGPRVQLDVYEKGSVGGRLATITVNKQQYESGGASVHSLNLHMQDFVKLLGECSPHLGSNSAELGTLWPPEELPLLLMAGTGPAHWGTGLWCPSANAGSHSCKPALAACAHVCVRVCTNAQLTSSPY